MGLPVGNDAGVRGGAAVDLEGGGRGFGWELSTVAFYVPLGRFDSAKTHFRFAVDVDKDLKAIKNWLGFFSFAHMRGDVFLKVETGGKDRHGTDRTHHIIHLW